MKYKNLYLLIIILFVFNFFYFKVNVLAITDLKDVSVNAVVGSIINPTVVTEGPAGPVLLPQTAVQFRGRAYPYSEVFLLRDGVFISSVFADPDSFFNINIPEDEGGSNMYTLYAVDKNNTKSLFLNFPTRIKEGYLNFINNILFAPTIVSDKNEVASDGFVNVSGYAYPNASLEIVIKNNTYSKTFNLSSKKDGTYSINLPLNSIPKGDYNLFVKYQNDTRFSKLLKLIISNKNILNDKKVEYLPGDCNKDNIINLIDFSVLAFWYKKDNPPLCVDTNKDNFIDLVDFSILAYYWNS